MYKLKIKKGSEARIIKGHPWIYSNEIQNFSDIKKAEIGELVEVIINEHQYFATAYFNPHSLIAARILSYNQVEKINLDFFVKRIKSALSLRDRFFDEPFYRLIHSEGDSLPGLIIDRFDNVFSCQISTAGMEKLTPTIIEALEEVFVNPTIVLRNESYLRKMENLELYSRLEKGELSSEIIVTENAVKYYANLLDGQKTGWFYDQRKNRQYLASLCKDAEVFDAFCYLGGFGISALKNGAKSVTFVDSSQEALQLLQRNIALNEISQECEIVNDKVFDVLESAKFSQRRYDVVNLDPPAFIKSKKDFFSGIKGYEKLVKLAAKLLKPNSILMLSSCSHNATVADLTNACAVGFSKAKRSAKLIRTFGADCDHAIHPALKENEYLKSLTFFVE